jgi:hypothetical protein
MKQLSPSSVACVPRNVPSVSQKRSTSRICEATIEDKKMTRHIEEECPWPPGDHWDNADLLFMTNVVARGMAFSDVAGFLCRSEEEVRKKSKLLHGQHAQGRRALS